MKKALILVLIAILFGVGGFFVGRYDWKTDKKNSIHLKNIDIEKILSDSDEFRQLSDEELVATCQINGYTCPELVKKFNETDLYSSEGTNKLIGMEPVQFFDDGGTRSYHLPDGRNLWYDQALKYKEEKCDEDGTCTAILADSFGSVTINYPDGRSLHFDRAGNFVKLEKKDKDCKINGHPCSAVVRELNNPQRQIPDEVLLGTTQPPVCGSGGGYVGWIYTLKDGTLLLHQSSKDRWDSRDTTGFVLIVHPHKDWFYFDKDGYPYPGSITGEWAKLSDPIEESSANTKEVDLPQGTLLGGRS